MTSSIPSFTPWTGGRVPLQDESQEAARTAAYWEWLTRATPFLEDTAPVVAEVAGAGSWVRLMSSNDADVEAAGMRHSIGHSWDKYSKFGDIYGLRDLAGSPQATVLVAGGVVVHAREQENSRLSADNEALLEDLARDNGWTIKKDELPFDLLRNDTAPNTRFKYLIREADNSKSFQSIVLEGRLTDEEIRWMAGSLKNGRYFLPGMLDLPPAPGGGRDFHEVLSVKFVTDEPTAAVSAKQIVDAWESAVRSNWESYVLPEMH